jgi:hypothetical protein
MKEITNNRNTVNISIEVAPGVIKRKLGGKRQWLCRAEKNSNAVVFS